MAIKQALSIGSGSEVFNFAIFRDNELIQDAWNLSAGNTITTQNVTPNYFNDIFKILGNGLSGICDSIGANEEITLFSLTDGNVTITHNGAQTGTGYKRYYPTLFYNHDGTSIRINGGYAIYRYYNGGTLTDAYLSLLFDDETKEAKLILSNIYPQNNIVILLVAQYTGSAQLTSQEQYNAYRQSITVYEPDPWGDINSDIGGGNGSLDITSDTIDLPAFPLSLVDTGFVQLFSPSFSQLSELARYMWNSTFLEDVLKLWNDPMNIIISLLLFPLSIPSENSRVVHAGNVITTVRMNYPDNQFLTLDCGTLHVDNFYNAYLDYEPYTKCEVFLPYIGSKPLSMDDILGKDVNIKYTIDLMTGICVANILCDNSVYYSFTGNCGVSVPITSQSFDALITNAFNVALTGFSGELFTPSGASHIASNVMTSKPFISKTGNVSSNAGMLSPQKPYFTFTVPRICLPKNQNTMKGYPILYTTKLSELAGYTEIDTIYLDNCTATSEEKAELEQILKGGFFA